MRLTFRVARQTFPIVLFTIVLFTSLISLFSLNSAKNVPLIYPLANNIKSPMFSPSLPVPLNYPLPHTDDYMADDKALSLLVEKCHKGDSTISSNTYTTGDYEFRKKDWLSSCYPIEISSSARSIGHCSGILLLIRRCRFIYSFRRCKVVCAIR